MSSWEAEMAETGGRGGEPIALIIDCDGCAVRGVGCDDCVVTTLLDLDASGGAEELALDPDEARALDALASGGLLPPLRLTRQARTG